MRLLQHIALALLITLFVSLPIAAGKYLGIEEMGSDELQKNNVIGFSIGFVSLAHFHDDFVTGGGQNFGITVDDSFSANLDWSYYITPKNGFLVSVSYSPTEANLFLDAAEGPEGDANLYWVDAAWVHRVLYGDTAVVFQLGVGAVSLEYDDTPLTIAGQPPTSPQDDESLTAHIGLGARTLFSENWFLEVKGRYHYVDNLNTEVSSLRFDDSPGFFEGTIGVAFQF